MLARKRLRRDNPSRRDKFQWSHDSSESAQNSIIIYFSHAMASHARDSINKNSELFRRMLDERTARLPSVGFLDADTENLGYNVTLDERDRDSNDEILVSCPTATREEPPVNFGLVICN